LSGGIGEEHGDGVGLISRADPLDETGAGRERREIESIGIDADEQPSWLRGDHDRSGRRDLDLGARRRSGAGDHRRDPRKPDVSDHHQARRASKLDAPVVDGRESGGQEIDRNEPASPRSDDGGRERDDAAVGRDHRTVGGGDDRAPAVGHRDAARKHVLPEGDAKERIEVVQRHELAPALDDGGDGPAALARHESERRCGRPVLCLRRGKHQRQDCRHEGCDPHDAQ
jgi:hypothetical protein